ncbi:MAG: AAA family ATPase [Gracilibacteraceae bacterium]|jgi:predicted AAA+ superfamily ATPase|nr:AAA family ATPase [Gracilibacteraceae bacterium]
MNENSFITGQELLNAIETQTTSSDGRFQLRDFVSPLIDYCLDGNYSARIGMVYGLRSTGKTVGMLQAIEELMKRGHLVAYGQYSYDSTAMSEVNEQILSLVRSGYKFFFIDEASYLSGFLNQSASWADTFMPVNKIKIVISGTDSFLLNAAQITSLFHRFVQFSSNWNSFSEFKRITGKSFAEYKRIGGIFTDESMPRFIRSAIVDNLIHTLEHCLEDANRQTVYTSRLFGIGPDIIYKAVISILKCTADDAIVRHFVSKSAQKNISDLGSALANLSNRQKRDIKERVAEAIEPYRDFTPIRHPQEVIEALLEFLTEIGCLSTFHIGANEYGSNDAYAFAHNALMNYSINETKNGILQTSGIDKTEFTLSVEQAAEGAINENIVLAHIIHATENYHDAKSFKYQDIKQREIDAVLIDRESKSACLIEVKSKSRISPGSVFSDEARHLFDAEVMKQLGFDQDYTIARIIAYNGSETVVVSENQDLLLVNIEQLAENAHRLGAFIVEVCNRAPYVWVGAAKEK